MQIAICDDQSAAREQLASYMSEYFTAKFIAADIDYYTCGEAFLNAYTPGKYDVLFLDIYMTGLTGVDVVRHIREQEDDCEIIFITTSAEHYREGYDLRILEYIRKPLDKERIFLVLDRLFRLFAKAKLYLKILCERETVKILYDSILWIEVYGHKTILHTSAMDYATRIPLEQINIQLPTPPFYRLNKSELVNFDTVTALENHGLRLNEKIIVPVDFTSRYGKNVRKLYRDYLFAKGREGLL